MKPKATDVPNVKQTLERLRGISEDHSRHRYAADKWSIRQVLSHRE